MGNTTVLIPNYNGIEYLKNCLPGLKGRPVIIVDNGSEDGSEEYIRREYPEIELIELRENTGFCHAVNLGLKRIHTKYVFLLNNDTVVDEDAISSLEARMDENNHIFSAQARILNMLNHDLADDCGDYYTALGWAFARGKDKDSRKYMKPVDIFAGCGAAVMYRMELFDDIGMFDENHFAYLEDIDLGYRARIQGYRNVYEPSALVYHAGSGTSGSRYNSFKIRLSSRNSIYLVYKNMPLLQIIINLPFLIAGSGIKIFFFFKKGMGRVYLKGLAEGFKLCKEDAEDGYRHKVMFRLRNLPNYLKIQIELWVNVVRRLSN